MSKYIDGIHEERFDAFLSDLRSGEYTQGKSALHTLREQEGGTVDERLCCLGVACVRPAAEGLIRAVRPRTLNRDYGEDVYYDGYTADLPPAVADYLGIPARNRIHKTGSTDIAFYKLGYEEGSSKGQNWTAIGLNDSMGYTFAQIADAFENEFKKEIGS